MPTYEYSCKKCGHTFETFQSMKDDPLQCCPEDKCAQKPWAQGEVKRLLGTGAGLIFKGSGFYITDYRSESYQQAAKKESGASDAGGKSSSGESTGGSKSGGDTSSASAPAKAKDGRGAGGATKSSGGGAAPTAS